MKAVHKSRWLEVVLWLSEQNPQQKEIKSNFLWQCLFINKMGILDKF